jgi:hypothetical protein
MMSGNAIRKLTAGISFDTLKWQRTGVFQLFDNHSKELLYRNSTDLIKIYIYYCYIFQ